MAIGVQITIDCANPARLARFWAEALQYKIQDAPQGFSSWEEWLRSQHIPQEQWDSFSAVVDPAGKGPRIFFQRVPEGKTVKNRVHLDVNVSKQLSEPSSAEEQQQYVIRESERLQGLGARELYRYDEHGEFWITLADPEGNEFCIQ